METYGISDSLKFQAIFVEKLILATFKYECNMTWHGSAQQVAVYNHQMWLDY